MKIEDIKNIPENTPIELKWRGEIRKGSMAEGYKETDDRVYIWLDNPNSGGKSWAKVKAENIIGIIYNEIKNYIDNLRPM